MDAIINEKMDPEILGTREIKLKTAARETDNRLRRYSTSFTTTCRHRNQPKIKKVPKKTNKVSTQNEVLRRSVELRTDAFVTALRPFLKNNPFIGKYYVCSACKCVCQ